MPHAFLRRYVQRGRHRRARYVGLVLALVALLFALGASLVAAREAPRPPLEVVPLVDGSRPREPDHETLQRLLARVPETKVHMVAEAVRAER